MNIYYASFNFQDLDMQKGIKQDIVLKEINF